MPNMLTVQIPNNKSNREYVAGVLSIPGVIAGNTQEPSSSKYLSLKEGAVVAGVNYFTFRKWVVIEKKIPYERPSGMRAGSVKILRSDLESFMEGKGKKKQRRNTAKVSII
jgi:hypothetical protein